MEDPLEALIRSAAKSMVEKMDVLLMEGVHLSPGSTAAPGGDLGSNITFESLMETQRKIEAIGPIATDVWLIDVPEIHHDMVDALKPITPPSQDQFAQIAAFALRVLNWETKFFDSETELILNVGIDRPPDLDKIYFPWFCAFPGIWIEFNDGSVRALAVKGEDVCNTHIVYYDEPTGTLSQLPVAKLPLVRDSIFVLGGPYSGLVADMIVCDTRPLYEEQEYAVYYRSMARDLLEVYQRSDLDEFLVWVRNKATSPNDLEAFIDLLRDAAQTRPLDLEEWLQGLIQKKPIDKRKILHMESLFQSIMDQEVSWAMI